MIRLAMCLWMFCRECSSCCDHQCRGNYGPEIERGYQGGGGLLVQYVELCLDVDDLTAQVGL